ncbi:MAG: c-type cytochrome biogenesis protein CcsB [Candidatus Sumerlaeota bacterium]|nr:c-type cytochrome biogenesis protein CcsB [Candidatus Sumerlaeota bacterium]
MAPTRMMKLCLSSVFLHFLFFAFAAISASGFAAEAIPAMSAQWSRALEPLRTMPVQDTGFVRSGVTFAENYWLAIYGKIPIRGTSPLWGVLWLMSDPQKAADIPLLKIEHPRLAEFFGGATRISLNAYHKRMDDPALQEQIRSLAMDASGSGKAFLELATRAERLENLEEDFSILPFEGEWMSPAQWQAKQDTAKALAAGAAAARAKAPAGDPLDEAILKQWEALKAALRKDDPAAGAQAAQALTEAIAQAAQSRRIALPRLGLDAFYHEHHPFKKSAFFYLLAAICYGVALMRRQKPGGRSQETGDRERGDAERGDAERGDVQTQRRPALSPCQSVSVRVGPWEARDRGAEVTWYFAMAGIVMLVVGLAEQILGITARWMISGRAPLSDMYESFTFATAGMILVALGFELFQAQRRRSWKTAGAESGARGQGSGVRERGDAERGDAERGDAERGDAETRRGKTRRRPAASPRQSVPVRVGPCEPRDKLGTRNSELGTRNSELGTQYLAGFSAALLGFVFMILAHKLPIFDSKIRPILPALQSSWLTYHVITIMLSYAAFALSFFASLCYLGKDALGGDNSSIPLARFLPSLEALDVFNYKIIAVGFPLLTLGIILGAVWASTAWGRPWGFDPKETWSAVTWLVYAIYLHIRFIGGWKGRGAAIVALIGFLCVLFTYLGVNFLLPSIHSYAR